MLKGALIGCGFFAENHLHAWQDIPDVEIVAICDQNSERLDFVGDKFDISQRFTTAEALFDDGELDFVDIATTVDSHVELVCLSAHHKIPTICQKPFATSIAGAKKMVAAAREAEIPLMVHENFRWQSPIQAVRKVLDAGEIGEPFWGRFSFRSAYDVFSGQPYLAEGKRFIIEDLGIHTLDIARFLMGDVSELSARTARINPAIQGEDVATILLSHVNGYSSVVDCSYASQLPVEAFPETLVEIDGTAGTLRLRQGYQLEVYNAEQNRIIDVSPPLLPWASKPWHNIQESVLAIQAHWVDCLKNSKTPQTSGEDNLKTLAMVEAAYDSDAHRKQVNIEDLLA